MANKPTLLARMLGRGNHPVVSDLAAVALNQPLMIDRNIGEAVVGGYLSGTFTSADSACSFEIAGPEVVDGEQATEVKQKRIAVINISGPLVNRPMPGPSGGGPASYAKIGDIFDAMVEDDSVDAIVMRLDSPGGMVSGCFDLTDKIFNARGSKPIHALVDDRAASACFAIAAACDDIWVSRTGNVGSVGVVGYHADFSGAEAKMGVKVTAIYAGDRKIDGSSHFPLSDQAKEDWQANVDAIYDMFVGAVSTYRNMASDDVRATQASTYMGQAAIDAGFATRLGTWEDLMAHLNTDAPAADAPGDSADDDEASADHGADTSRIESAIAVAEMLEAESKEIDVQLRQLQDQLSNLQSGSDEVVTVKSKETALGEVISLSKERNIPAAVALAIHVTESTVAAEAVDYAAEVVSLCKTAGMEQKAASFVSQSTSIEDVRKSLVEAKAGQDEKAEVITILPAAGAAKPSANPLDPNLIYQNRGKKNG